MSIFAKGEKPHRRYRSTLKLSICIPTFNRAALLRETLLSLLPQMQEEMEIVVSDNASTDGTDAMIAGLMVQYPCIAYHRWPQNMGADRNYLRAVEAARGEYCWLFGSDDLVEPGTVTQVFNLLNDHCDIYLFNRMEWRVDLDVKIPCYWLEPQSQSRVFDFTQAGDCDEFFARAQLLGALFSYLSSIVVRRAAWFSIPYDESYTGTAYSHAFILLSMVEKGCSLHYDRRQLVNCRLGNDAFLHQGIFKRIMLDLVGYSKIRDDVFGSRPKLRQGINRVLHREYKWLKLASRCSDLNPGEWKKLREALKGVGYPARSLFCAGALGNLRWAVRTLRWARDAWLKTVPG